MTLRPWLQSARKLLGTSTRGHSRRHRQAPPCAAQLETLESKQLLAAAASAGISYDKNTNVVTITGENSQGKGDVATVTESGNQIIVKLTRSSGLSETKTFKSSSVTRVDFFGLNGDDKFDNKVNIDSKAEGGAGNDTLYGGIGNDAINGGDGDDKIDGRNRKDTLKGGDGNDTISGGDDKAADELHGGNGADVLKGQEGADSLYGNGGDDLLQGGDGDDFLQGGLGIDECDGGDGTDTLIAELGESADYGLILTNSRLNENVLKGIEKAELTGNSKGNLLDASGFTKGSVTLKGGGGNDTLYGGTNDDMLYGEDGNDELDGKKGDDKLYGGSDHDTLRGWAGADVLVGGSGNDQLNVILDFDTLVDRFDGDALLPYAEYLKRDAGTDKVNVTLDLGSLGDVVSEFVTQAQNVTREFQPILDLLNSDVPVVSKYFGSTTWSDLLEQFGYGDYVTFADAIDSLNHVDVSKFKGEINLGEFKVSSPTAVTQSDAGESTRNLSVGNAKGFGFHIPLLEDRTSVIDLLMNQNVDLVRFDLPTLSLHGDVDTSFSVPIPGVNIADAIVSFGGAFDFTATASLGYDLHGIRTNDLRNGFFVANASATFSASLYAEGGVGKKHVVEVGVGGEVAGSIVITFVDQNADGRVHFDEYQGTALDENCHYELYAYLKYFGGGEKTKELADGDIHL